MVPPLFSSFLCVRAFPEKSSTQRTQRKEEKSGESSAQSKWARKL
jgi:hypothetical protein